jgi:hypothetical protein
MSCFKRLLSCQTHPRYRNTKGVYVLELKDGKYYVGESRDIRYRMWTHVNLNGPAWTQKYGVIKRITTITNEMNTFWELNETLEQMKLRGIENVRGSMFSNIQLTREQRGLAAQLVCEKEGLCRKCGDESHFEDRCKQIHKSSWMSAFLGQEKPIKPVKPMKPIDTGPAVRFCVVCDTLLSPNPPLNYCGDFCRQRHLV